MERLLVFLSLLASVSACSEATGDSLPPREVKKPDAPLIYQAQASDVETYFDATGHAQADIRGVAKAVSPLAGVVERVLVGVGGVVKKGQPLAVINSADISDLYSSYLANKAQLFQTERLYLLNKELLQNGIVAKSDFLVAEGNYKQIQATLRGQEAKMRQYGVSPGEDFVHTLTVSAPIDGVVAELYAHIGDRTDSTNAVALIANPEEMLVVADLHDVDIPALGGRNSAVHFRTDIPPAREWTGSITYISDVQDPDTKTVKVYIKLKDSGFQFRQNMFFKLRIFGEKKLLPSIPKSALVYRDNKFFVYVMKDEKPALREVKPFRDVSDRLVAVEGIEVDQKVVISAMDQERP